MNSTLNSMDLARGKALLSRLPDGYSAILKTARLQEGVGNEIVCTFEVPGAGKRAASAPSSTEAIRLVLTELASLLDSPFFSDPEQPINGNFSSSEKPAYSSNTKIERFHSKTRQLTVGVTMPTSLKEHLTTLAESQRTSFAEVARKFAVFGFEDFVDRSLFVSSRTLFDTLGCELTKWQSSDHEQVMLRLDPSHAVRMRSTAKEYGKSASEFGTLCIAHGFVLQEQLVSLEQKIANCKGPAIRPLLAQLGLGSYAASLLSGVFAGSIRAPKALLKKLANFFEAQETLLTVLFKRSFESRMVPAFKAENGKPEVSKVATQWDVAVRSLNLPPDQTKALLDLNT